MAKANVSTALAQKEKILQAEVESFRSIQKGEYRFDFFYHNERHLGQIYRRTLQQEDN